MLLFQLSNMNDKRLSIALARLLRHSAREDGVSISKDGWVTVNDVLNWTKRQNINADEAVVRRIVSENDKQRFSLRESPVLSIRANQGHSMQFVELKLSPLNVSDGIDLAVHGTYYKNWKSIKTQGLSRMNRKHIHFARDMPGQSGVISGMRNSCELLIWINIKKALDRGIAFFLSDNGVILTEGVGGIISPDLFSHVQDRQSQEVIYINSNANQEDKDKEAHIVKADKKQRKILKLLREITILKERVFAGEKLEENQRKKIDRENELKSELDMLLGDSHK